MKKNVILKKPYSSNPQDKHLSIVLCELPDNAVTPYATFLYNSRDDAYFSGKYYYEGELEKATKEWDERRY